MSILFGKCRMTQTADGWQATCLHPAHAGGLVKCTKTRSNAAAGSEDLCVRQLKTWVLLGGCADKNDHFRAWSHVLALTKHNRLDSMGDLDRLRPPAPFHLA